MSVRFLYTLAIAFFLSACGGGSSSTSNPTAPPVNLAPVVNAGADVTIRLPTNAVNLDATVTDDGLPSGRSISTVWTVQSGPGGAVFADPNAIDTTVTFVNEGTYELLLTADDTALQGSDTLQVVVEAAAALDVITVTPSDVILEPGEKQTFRASGLDQYSDPIPVNISWSASGGTIDVEGTYTAGETPGVFVVRATDGTAVGSIAVTISSSPPRANAGGPYVGFEGTPVALDGSGSTDPDDDITDYDWDLDNDGAFDDATGATPTFASARSGVYTIRLRVTDAFGATDANATTVTLDNVAPIAEAGGPYSGNVGVDIRLNGSASFDPGNDIVSYEWDLDNDGQFDDATSANTVFSSATSGTFTVGLRVTDADGASGTDTATVTVSSTAPTADAGGPYSGDQGVDIVLDASGSSDPSGIATYEWDLDNDSSYETAGVTATFNSASAGVFPVGLRVTDNDGDTATTIVEVTVNDLPPIADAGGPYSGDQGADITLDGSGSDDPSGIALYEWDFDNDGAFDDAAGVNPAFNSAAAGVFTIGLQVTDNDGSTATATASVTVNDVAPAAPTEVSAAGNDGRVILDWADNVEPDLAAAPYRVYRSETQGGSYTVLPGGRFSASDYVDLTVTNGTTYYYVVTAEDGAGNESAFSAEVATTPNGEVHAYWTLDEGAGLTIADTVAPDDGSGTINGATWATGVSGAALDFDGSDFVVIDNTPQLQITGTEISMVAWIFPRDGEDDLDARVISKRTDAGGSDVYAMMLREYRLVFRIDGQDMISSHIVRLNDWVHVAMVYDGTEEPTGRMRIYVNGVLDLAVPLAKEDPIDASFRPVHLGMREGEALHFDGIIDDVQILNRALSAGEVANLYGLVTPPAPAPGLSFTDITVSAGLSDSLQPTGGHGVMFADVDNNSLPDIYVTNNLEGTPNRADRLYMNIDGATFEEDGVGRGVDDTDGGSRGAVWADLDNDGDYDLVNGTTWDNAAPSRGNPDNNNVFENDGSGSFAEVTPASIASTETETRGVTAFDMDADGDLDLFSVSNIVGVPSGNEAYRNDGGFNFTSYSGGELITAWGMQGVVDTDYDGDGDIDIMAANRSGDFIVLNNDGTGIFTRVTLAELGFTQSAGDGIDTADVDNDGDLDVLLVTRGIGYLYERRVDELYYLKQTFPRIDGFMGNFADLDNDGDQDLVFTGDEKVYLNRGDGTFDPGQSMPVSGIDDPRAIAFADIDADGDLDFAIAAAASRNWLVRNDIDAVAGNWLSVELVSPACQAGAFGARVTLTDPGNGGAFVGMREAKGNHGYLSQDDPVLHFGLGVIAAVDVVVDFVDGTQVTVPAAPANSRIVIDECPAP